MQGKTADFRRLQVLTSTRLFFEKRLGCGVCNGLGVFERKQRKEGIF